MRKLNLSTSIIEFDEYPVGKYNDATFKVPEKTRMIKLVFNKKGHITAMLVQFEGKIGVIEMTTKHNWFNL